MIMTPSSLVLVTKYSQLVIGFVIAGVALVKLPEGGRSQLGISWHLLPVAELLAAAWATRSKEFASHTLAIIGSVALVALVAWQLLDSARIDGFDPFLALAFLALLVPVIVSCRALVLDLRSV